VGRSRSLLILTRDRANASFRQRIEPYLEPLAAAGVSWEVVRLARAPWSRHMQLVRAREFDGVLLHRKTLTAWDAWILRKAARRLIYDFDDAVMYQARSPREAHGGRRRRFRRTAARADRVIAGSRILAEHARGEGAAWVEVIATGLDTHLFQPKTDYRPTERLRLVWIGSRSTLKQLRPFRQTFEALGRAMPGVTLRIVSDGELAVPGLAIENVPWRLDAEGRLLAESDVGIAPMPDTPYTRGKCGFKVVQYMAAGLPVITSPVGVNADYVRPDVTGLWAQTTEEWIAAVRRLAADAALRARMGRMARQRAVTEFDFAVLAPKVVDLVTKALE